MDRLIYSSLTAMRGAMARQTATANNIANVNTPAFRADIARAEALWLHGSPHTGRAVAREGIAAADMTAGTIVTTGRDLDIAINGDAMLAVQADNGDEAYSRRGDLQISPNGLLVTGDGRPVLGTDGPIIVPPADSVSIGADGAISIVPQNGDPAQPQDIAKLKLASPVGSDVVKGIDGLFRVRGGGILPNDPAARLVTRALEGSNVNATAALVEMIEASRSWDTQLKLIGDARDIDAATADLMRLSQ